jgi:hypothetical protein
MDPEACRKNLLCCVCCARFDSELFIRGAFLLESSPNPVFPRVFRAFPADYREFYWNFFSNACKIWIEYVFLYTDSSLN